MALNDYAFGIDTEQYSSSKVGEYPEKLMDWKVAALHDDPPITFVFVRAGISYAFKDTRFDFNWDGVRDMDMYRTEAGISTYPVGRGAYHVLYPSQAVVPQYDNFMRIVDPVADWEHDRLVIDLELNQDQNKRTITDKTKAFAYKLKDATGRYPILYSRAYWMIAYTYPEELTFLDLWLAQYLYPQLPYTPEYPPPPSKLPTGHNTWLVMQTGDHCKPIGSPVKQYMDYNRWNGGAEVVANYFGFQNELPGVPATIEERLTRLEKAVFGG